MGGNLMDGFPSHWARPFHWNNGPAPQPAQTEPLVCSARQYEPLSAGLTLVTSLPTRFQPGLQTWVAIGCRVVAQNTAAEIEQLQPQYPFVHDWISCDDVDDSWGYPAQKLYNLLRTASEFDNAAIVNSDLEIIAKQRKLQDLFRHNQDAFVCGLRWNYDLFPSQAIEFEWGIDALKITCEQFESLPANMPYVLGQPMWDYAIPALLMAGGFKPKVPHLPVLFHQNHPQRWQDGSHRQGVDWLNEYLGIKFDAERFRKLQLDPDYVYTVDRYLYNHWRPLHRYAPEHADGWSIERAKHWYFDEWLPKVPSVGCSCPEHWADITKLKPPCFDSPRDFFEWSWARHDDVSREHSKKPRITLREAYLLYWPTKTHFPSIDSSRNTPI